MAVHLIRMRDPLANLQKGGGTARASPKGRPPPLRGYQVLPTHPPFTISGVTRDNSGVPLASCEVELYARNQDQTFGTYVNRTVSDGSGNFSFNVGIGRFYQHIAYKIGSPDLAGISLETLQGTQSTTIQGV